MAKILVVDDEVDFESLVRQKFRKKIRKKEYEFLFAHNGEEALEQIKDHTDIDMVLSDINMPVMDGLTLLSKIKEQQILLKSVIVSAYGDMENIRVAMNRGAFDFVTKPVDFTDLEQTMDRTIKHVKELKETMRAVKENNIMKLYVDDVVLNHMGGQEFESSLTASEIIDATVVFIDICGFTSLSETTGPSELVNLLNTYFDIMVQEIIAQSGYVDKFIGDAIMAVFRDEDHLGRALKACIATRDKIKSLPDEMEGLVFKPEVSIGINSGDMIFGNIGSKSLKRLDFTVLGNVVNTSQRLQSLAAPSQILISEETYNKIDGQVKCKSIGAKTLKNKAEQIIVYEVLS